jgi:two-component system response regulator HydG
MTQKPTVLIVDDETGILDSLRILLKKEGYEVTAAQGGKAGLDQIRGGNFDIVLSDIRMPQVSGLDILAAVREQDPLTPVILMTAQASLQTAIGAVNAGAYYYIQKPFANDELVAILRRASDYRAVRVENKQLKQEIRRRERGGADSPVGKSRRFIEVLKLAEQVAPTESTVLIQGESGTGKEVLARYIHDHSSRSEGPFLSINCGALPENLLESELFGHVKGSFTGAVRDKQGLFTAARGGSFFLDEVGEMPPGAGGHSGGRHRGGECRCADHRRDQPRSRGGNPPRHLPVGSVLPAQRHSGPAAAAARPAGRHRAPPGILPPASGHRAQR